MSVSWLTRAKTLSEGVAVALLTAMFFSFILQVVFRYVVREPLGWTLEACLLSWLWIVFWGAAFLLDDRDHVRFDILYNHVSPRLRALFAGVSAVSIIAAMLIAFPASWDFVTFMKIESTSLLKVRFDFVFSIYLVFVVVTVLRYGARLWRIVRSRGADPDGAREQETLL